MHSAVWAGLRESAGKGKPSQSCWANDQAGQRLRVGGRSSCMRRAPLKVVGRHDADCLFFSFECHAIATLFHLPRAHTQNDGSIQTVHEETKIILEQTQMYRTRRSTDIPAVSCPAPCRHRGCRAAGIAQESAASPVQPAGSERTEAQEMAGKWGG